jgi:hypothetical protein
MIVRHTLSPSSRQRLGITVVADDDARAREERAGAARIQHVLQVAAAMRRQERKIHPTGPC